MPPLLAVLEVEEMRQHFFLTTPHGAMFRDGMLRNIGGHSWSRDRRPFGTYASSRVLRQVYLARVFRARA